MILPSDAARGFNAIVLPLDDAFESRLHAAEQFWRSIHGRGPGKPYGGLPVQSRTRHILNLRVFDARRSGASYRQIAEALLAHQQIVSRDWRDHPLKHKVKATLRRAEGLVAGGYRDLLYYPHRRRSTKTPK